MPEAMSEDRLAEIEALRLASDLDPLQSTHIISDGYTHLANLTEEIGEGGKPRVRCLAMMPKEWADYVAAAVNAAPELLAEVRRLQEQVKDLHNIPSNMGELYDAIVSSNNKDAGVTIIASYCRHHAMPIHAERDRERQRAEILERAALNFKEAAEAAEAKTKELQATVEEFDEHVKTCNSDRERQRADKAEAELKGWQDYWGCDSPHDSHVQIGTSEPFARQLGKEQARANKAGNELDRERQRAEAAEADSRKIRDKISALITGGMAFSDDRYDRAYCNAITAALHEIDAVMKEGSDAK